MALFDGPVIRAPTFYNDGTNHVLRVDQPVDLATNNLITGGVLKLDIDGSAENAAGSLTLGAGNDAGLFFDGTNLVVITNGAGASGIVLDSEDDTVEILGSGTLQATFSASGLNLASGDGYSIAGTEVLNATTLGSGVTASSLVSLGTITTDIQLDADLDFVGAQSITTSAGDLTVALADGGDFIVKAASTTHIQVFDVKDSSTITRFHVSPITAHASGSDNLVQITGRPVDLTGAQDTTYGEIIGLAITQHSFTGTNTGQIVTTAATLKISAAPTTSGNATITNPYSIWVDGGTVRLDAGAIIGASDSTDKRIDDASSGSGTATLYIGNETIDTTASDERMKDNVIAATDAYAQEVFDKLAAELKEFDWNAESGRNGEHDMAHVAQSLDLVLPQFVRKPTADLYKDCVSCVGETPEEQSDCATCNGAGEILRVAGDTEGDGSDSYQSVSYQRMVPYLIKIVAMQGAKIAVLEAA